MANDGWEEWVSSLSEDELEMEAGRNKTSSKEKKRKAEQNINPAKRKKMDILNVWGAKGAEVDQGIERWLKDSHKHKENIPECWSTPVLIVTN